MQALRQGVNRRNTLKELDPARSIPCVEGNLAAQQQRFGISCVDRQQSVQCVDCRIHRAPLGERSSDPKQQIARLILLPEPNVNIRQLSLDRRIVRIALQHLFEDARRAVVIVLLLCGVGEDQVLLPRVVEQTLLRVELSQLLHHGERTWVELRDLLVHRDRAQRESLLRIRIAHARVVFAGFR